MNHPEVMIVALTIIAAIPVGAFFFSLCIVPVIDFLRTKSYVPPSWAWILVRRSGVRHVLLRQADIGSRHGTLTCGYAMGMLPCFKIIVLDRTFLRYASTQQLMFVIGHELGHHKLGHTSFRHKIEAVCRMALPGRFSREDAADEYARLLTGCPQSVMAGYRQPSEVSRGT